MRVDTRSERDRPSRVHLSEITSSARMSKLFAPTDHVAKLVRQTIEELLRTPGPEDAYTPTVREIEEASEGGLCRSLIRLERERMRPEGTQTAARRTLWVRHNCPEPIGTEQEKLIETILMGPEANGGSIPDEFPASPDILDVSFQMTNVEHVVYHYIWGFDQAWAIEALARIRLAPGLSPLQMKALLPRRYPMACVASYGGDWAPGIVLGYDNLWADVILICPGLLHECVRRIVPRSEVGAGREFFEDALRKQARRLEYKLDDYWFESIADIAEDFDDTVVLAKSLR